MQARKNDFSKEIRDLEMALYVMGFDFSSVNNTDPEIMAQILKDINLNFNAFDPNLEWVKILKRLGTEPISFSILKERMLYGILNNPPLYHGILELSNLQQSSLRLKLNTIQQEKMTYGIYLMVILEALTYLMVNNKDIEIALAEKIFKNRGSINYGSTFWNFLNRFKDTGWSVFSALKTVSVDPFMFESICFRQYPPFPSDEELEQFIRYYRLSGLNSKLIRRSQLQNKKEEHSQGGLYGNILEAVTNEELVAYNQWLLFSYFSKNKTTHKSIDNIKAGTALLYYLERFKEEHSSFVFKKAVFEFDPACEPRPSSDFKASFWDDVYAYKDPHNYLRTSTISSKAFANLYVAWNIGFVMRRFPTKFYMYLPKLFIPTTLCCVPEYYFSTRMISLWLTINFITRLRRKHSNFIIDHPYAALEAATTILGKHNMQYAKEDLLKNKVDLDQLYADIIYSVPPIANYVKAMRMILS